MSFEPVEYEPDDYSNGGEDEAQQPIKPARCRCYMPATATPPSVITAADQVRRNLRMSGRWARFGRLMVEQLLSEHDAAVERAEKAERELAEVRDEYANLEAESSRIADRAGAYRKELEELRKLAGNPTYQWASSAPGFFFGPPLLDEAHVRRLVSEINAGGGQAVLKRRLVGEWTEVDGA